jgi:hypothetical protein
MLMSIFLLCIHVKTLNVSVLIYSQLISARTSLPLALSPPSYTSHLKRKVPTARCAIPLEETLYSPAYIMPAIGFCRLQEQRSGQPRRCACTRS